MSMIIDGGHECPKCRSGQYEYINNDYTCKKCGVKSREYERNRMVENLLKYGFKEIKQYQKFLFIKTKQLESVYEYEGVIATHIKNSPNMRFNMNGDSELIFNNHGDYQWVSKHLDKIFNTKEFKRNRLLDELLGYDEN